MTWLALERRVDAAGHRLSCRDSHQREHTPSSAVPLRDGAQGFTVTGWPLTSSFSVRQVAGMREQAASGGAISPVQQMMASGTGALLTSLFGEILKKEQKKKNPHLSGQ